MHIVTSFSPRDAVVFAISLPLNTKSNKTFLFSVLDNRDLMAMLALPETLSNASLTLYDADGNLLISHNSGNVKNFVTIRQTSSVYGLTAELLINSDAFSEGLTRYKNIILLGMAMYVLLGIILSIIYSQSNARPLIHMLSAAENTCEEIGGNLSRLSQSAYPNGYQYLNAFISQVDSRLKANKLMLIQQENQLRTNLFERLIHGEVFLARTFDMARKYYPGFPSQYRMALVKLLSTAEMEPAGYAAKQIELRTILDPALPSNSYIHFSANMIVIILPCGYLDDRMEVESLLRSVGEQMISDANMDIRVAVSAPVSGLNQLTVIYHQLQHLLRMTDHMCQSIPFFIEDHKPIKALPDHGKHHSTYFYEHVIRAQQDMAQTLLDDDIELLRKSGYVHEADVQQLFFAYRHALAMALTLLDEQESGSIALPDYIAKDNLDDTFAQVKSCLHQVCAVFQSRQQTSTESFERTVMAMVDENIANPELYIRMVTEHFSISESTLQRTMHKATGKSFFEYVDMKRMNMARELITRTDQPINQIMVQCGYTSLNTFYKAFKRRYGMSPTAMRESKHPTNMD
jgi:AraC-like DNA-binding protein